jgi:hypothetical protein
MLEVPHLIPGTISYSSLPRVLVYHSLSCTSSSSGRATLTGGGVKIRVDGAPPGINYSSPPPRVSSSRRIDLIR